MMRNGGRARVNVCETGFNGGHSAMLFMSLAPHDVDVYYYGWDLGEVSAARPTADKMREKYADKFTITWGDSHQTLLNVEQILDGHLCDLIVIDGDHSKLGVVDDLTNLLRVAKSNATVFGDDW